MTGTFTTSTVLSQHLEEILEVSSSFFWSFYFSVTYRFIFLLQITNFIIIRHHKVQSRCVQSFDIATWSFHFRVVIQECIKRYKKIPPNLLSKFSFLCWAPFIHSSIHSCLYPVTCCLQREGWAWLLQIQPIYISSFITPYFFTRNYSI